MFTFTKAVAFIATCFCFLSTTLSYASDDNDNDDNDDENAPRSGGGFIIKSIFNMNSSLNSEFTRDGFTTPPKLFLLWGGRGFGVKENGWRIGGGGFGGGFSQKTGKHQADIGMGYGGFILQYDALKKENFNLLVGGLLGGGGAGLKIVSANKNGEISQSFVVLEPSVSLEINPSDCFKISLTTSYFLPITTSTETKDDTLKVSAPIKAAPSIALEFLFGKF